MRRSLALSLLLVVPAGLAAQDSTPAPGSYTRMILGAGAMPGAGLTALVGVDHKKATSKIGLRVMAEFRESMTGHSWAPHSYSNTYGLQVLGTRPFREGHRFEPYAFAGVGVYHRHGMFRQPLYDASNPLQTGSPITHLRNTSAEMLWGFGTNVRVMGMTFFGDLKLPTWRNGYIGYGRAGAVSFGIRF